MADPLGGTCLGSAATQSDYIGYWVDGGFIEAVVCPFADSFSLGTVPSIAFAVLLLGGLLVYLSITNESFVILAILGILLSGFILQVVTFGPLIEAWFLIIIFAGVGAIYSVLKKWSGS
jgi:hypothetical protein